MINLPVKYQSQDISKYSEYRVSFFLLEVIYTTALSVLLVIVIG